MILGVLVCIRNQPTGLLTYLDSNDDVPEDDIDRINVRDNLKLAQVTTTTATGKLLQLLTAIAAAAAAITTTTTTRCREFWLLA